MNSVAMIRKFGILFLISSALVLQSPLRSQASGISETRVIIADYRNETGSSNYAYLGSSLSSAVEEKMNDRFKFRRINAENPGVFARTGIDDTASLQKVADESKADIIIWGTYKPNKKTHILIQTILYINKNQKISRLPVQKAKLDSTIFQSVDKVAVALVERLKQLSKTEKVIETIETQVSSSLKPENFLSFAGFQYKDNCQKITGYLGSPEIKEKTKYDFTVYRYYARSLAISCYNDDASTSRKNKVLVVRIKSKEAAQNLKAKSKDSKLDLWGLKIDEIKKQLGEPGRVSSGNFTYEYKNATGRGNVNFICYDFWQNQCKELSIQWFY